MNGRADVLRTGIWYLGHRTIDNAGSCTSTVAEAILMTLSLSGKEAHRARPQKA
jgi:hypothetical protein